MILAILSGCWPSRAAVEFWGLLPRTPGGLGRPASHVREPWPAARIKGGVLKWQYLFVSVICNLFSFNFIDFIGEIIMAQDVGACVGFLCFVHGLNLRIDQSVPTRALIHTNWWVRSFGRLRARPGLWAGPWPPSHKDSLDEPPQRTGGTPHFQCFGNPFHPVTAST